MKIVLWILIIAAALAAVIIGTFGTSLVIITIAIGALAVTSAINNQNAAAKAQSSQIIEALSNNVPPEAPRPDPARLSPVKPYVAQAMIEPQKPPR